MTSPTHLHGGCDAIPLDLASTDDAAPNGCEMVLLVLWSILRRKGIMNSAYRRPPYSWRVPFASIRKPEAQENRVPVGVPAHGFSSDSVVTVHERAFGPAASGPIGESPET